MCKYYTIITGYNLNKYLQGIDLLNGTITKVIFPLSEVSGWFEKNRLLKKFPCVFTFMIGGVVHTDYCVFYYVTGYI